MEGGKLFIAAGSEPGGCRPGCVLELALARSFGGLRKRCGDSRLFVQFW